MVQAKLRALREHDAERERVSKEQHKQLVRLQEQKRKMSELLKAHNVDLGSADEVQRLRGELEEAEKKHEV